MEIVLISEEVIFALQIISIVGFLFLAILTYRSYANLKAPLLKYIAAAFGVIALSLVFRLTIPELEAIIGVDETILEALCEAIQFIAAFLFFYGLKLLKQKQPKGGEA